MKKTDLAYRRLFPVVNTVWKHKEKVAAFELYQTLRETKIHLKKNIPAEPVPDELIAEMIHEIVFDEPWVTDRISYYRQQKRTIVDVSNLDQIETADV